MSISKQGIHSVTKYFDPFLMQLIKNEINIRDNEHMCKTLCTWSLKNLTTLILNSFSSKTNELLAPA